MFLEGTLGSSIQVLFIAAKTDISNLILALLSTITMNLFVHADALISHSIKP